MTMRRMNVAFFILILLISLNFIACSKKQEIKGITLNMTLVPQTVTDVLYLKMDFDFTTTDEFKDLSDDYKVFVHFWRPKVKEMLIGDDHVPEQKISQWKAGDSIRYSRTIFIPKFLDEFDIDFEGYEKVNFSVGLYNPNVKDSKVILFEKVLDIQAASLNAPEVVYEEGWFQPESDQNIKNPDERNWRWTAQKAICVIENPKAEALLEIRGGVNKEKAPDQKVIIKINDNILEEFIPDSVRFSKKYIVPPGMMGDAEDFHLTIETDKTFVPKESDPTSSDERTLGVMIYFLYFRENYK